VASKLKTSFFDRLEQAMKMSQSRSLWIDKAELKGLRASNRTGTGWRLAYASFV